MLVRTRLNNRPAVHRTAAMQTLAVEASYRCGAFAEQSEAPAVVADEQGIAGPPIIATG